MDIAEKCNDLFASSLAISNKLKIKVVSGSVDKHYPDPKEGQK